MRAFPVLALVALIAGCGGGRVPDVTAEVQSTSLANVRSVNLFTVSLIGEKGKMFNSLLDAKIRREISEFLNPGARWTLTVIDVEYKTPNFKQKRGHYQLSLEAELVDMNGVRAWSATVETPELQADPQWKESDVRERLVEAVVEKLVEELPLGRLETVEEEETQP